MNTPIQEVLMLLGDKLVVIHEKDKEILMLKQEIEILRNMLAQKEVNG